MAETKYLISKCTLIPNEGSSLKEPYDLVRGVAAIDYYESVENPTIALIVTFIDVDQVIGREGITGGEYVDVTIKDGDEDEFKIESKKHRLILNSVRNMVTQSNKQVATLEFVSLEAITNETSRLNQKFTGNVSETVRKILEDDKQGILTKKKIFGPKKVDEIEEDRATNSYSFVGNLRRPFDTIQWLCPKTQSTPKSFGFLFYETIDGFHFRSIDKLLKQDAVPYQQADRPIEGNKIIENNVNQTNDIGMNLRQGMYANRTLYVDIENQTLQEVDFDVTKLDLKKPLKLLDGIEKHPSRLMLRVNDFGVAQVGAAKTEVQPESELAVYQNKSYIRNNLLFSQSLSISIPLNTTLRAGVMINIKLPLKKEEGNEGTDSYGSDRTNDPSGRYLILNLRHLVGGGLAETQLELIRDVFTA
tara:strand:+ start:25 stop:1278 length:1254 start_codon:yes stop_codon:yes gene_type:complete